MSCDDKERCDGVIIFTVPNQDRRTVDKCDMDPNYVQCSVDKLNLVLYYFDDDGGGSTFLQHWVSFPKIIKKRTKTRFDGSKKAKVFQKIYTKINSAFIYIILEYFINNWFYFIITSWLHRIKANV